ncbi:hypothetical protein [Shewanella sp. GXUN23E]|uniref:hypothetical protein n=1 Tax=Shewanella sp. GXUN23E TaxID=3422498 RepID=UPI003D7EF870
MSDEYLGMETSPEVLLAQLAGAYRGEVYGVAFFTHLLDHYQGYTDKESQRTVLQLMLNVERVTQAILGAHLPTLEVPCNPDDLHMQQLGIRDAEAWLTLPWPELMNTMLAWVAPYQRQYRQQFSRAGGFGPLFYLVDKHETALFECLQAAQQGEADAARWLRQFLAAYPHSGVHY